MRPNKHEETDKLSLSFSLFIALCVVGLFCAISIALANNIDAITNNSQQLAELSEQGQDKDDNYKLSTIEEPDEFNIFL